MTESFLGTAAADFPPSVVAAAERFVSVSRALDDRGYWPLRIFTNANLFLWHLDAFAGDFDPVPAMSRVLNNAADLLESARTSGLVASVYPKGPMAEFDPDAVTGPIFGDIYSPLSDAEYFDEAYQTLKVRLEVNGVDPHGFFGGKTVLDAGCGAGKYAAAMVRFGARQVIGVDITEGGIAKARAQTAKVDGGDKLSFKVGSVTEIPVPDASVDVAWCNSVLHLVERPERGIGELARVLKPGGRLFIYVNGRFGLLELLVRTLYAANQDLPRQLMQHALAATGMNPGRVAWVIGFTFANYRFMPQAEVERMLRDAGFEIEQQLVRGIATDQMEQVAAGLPFGRIKYGESKLNYISRRL